LQSFVVRGSAGRVVAESVECSDDGREIGDAHWDSYKKLKGEERMNVQKEGDVWNTLDGGGTGTASKVFQMIP
jgi:hypothetical protein